MTDCREAVTPWHWFPIESDDCQSLQADWKIQNGALNTGDGIASAIIMQLGTNKRRDNKEGWWGNQFMPFEVGSYLWTLQGKSLSSDTFIDAERFVRDALDPLIKQGLASDYTVQAFRKGGKLAITIGLLNKNGTSVFNGTFARVL